MSLENMRTGEQAPDQQLTRGNSAAQMGYLAEHEEDINSRRTIEVMSNERETLKAQLAELDSKIDAAVDAGMKNEGGLGKVHTEIGRQLTSEKEGKVNEIKALEKEMLDMQNPTFVQ